MERKLRLELPGGQFQTTEGRSIAMAKVRGRGNRTTEMRFRMGLVRAGVTGWTLHPKGLPGNPDFVFSEAKAAIFVDGCFWHGCPACGHIPKCHSSFWRAKLASTVQRDVSSTYALKGLGYDVLRFWEHELAEHLQDVVQQTSALVAALERRPEPHKG